MKIDWEAQEAKFKKLKALAKDVADILGKADISINDAEGVLASAMDLIRDSTTACYPPKSTKS